MFLPTKTTIHIFHALPDVAIHVFLLLRVLTVCGRTLSHFQNGRTKAFLSSKIGSNKLEEAKHDGSNIYDQLHKSQKCFKIEFTNFLHSENVSRTRLIERVSYSSELEN